MRNIKFRSVRLILAALLTVCGVLFATTQFKTYADVIPANEWHLVVYKRLSGDVSSDDASKEFNFTVKAVVSLKDPSNADKVAAFHNTFDSASITQPTGGSAGIVDDTIVFTYSGTSSTRSVDRTIQVTSFQLDIPQDIDGNSSIVPSDLQIEYTITESGAEGFDTVYFNSVAQSPSDGSVTYTVTKNGETVFNRQEDRDDIVVRNHKGSGFKAYKIKKIDALTGDEVAGTFEFTMRDREGSGYHNVNLNKIVMANGEAVELPYPAEYDVQETVAPDGYVPITTPYNYSFKIKIDVSGNVEVTKPNGYDITVDEDELTITVPNFKQEDYKGDVELTKELVTSSGGDVPALAADREFEVQLTLMYYGGSVQYPRTASQLTGTFGDVEFTRGEATVTIKNGETLKITDVPVAKNSYIYYDGEWTKISDSVLDMTVLRVEETDWRTYRPAVSADHLETRNGNYPEFLPADTTHAKLTNTLQVYDVVIRKTDGAETEDIGGAKLAVFDREENVVDEWTSVAGESHTIEGALLANETYVLRELEAPYGYEPAADIEFSTDSSGNILIGEESVEDRTVVMKDEELPKGDIAVTKKVTGDADPSKAYSFTLTLTDANGEPVANYAFGSDTTDADGKITFELKAGETKTVADIPDGTSYVIEEDDYTSEGFDAPEWDTDPEGTIEGAAPNSLVEFTVTNNLPDEPEEPDTTEEPDEPADTTDKEPLVEEPKTVVKATTKVTKPAKSVIPATGDTSSLITAASMLSGAVAAFAAARKVRREEK